MRACVSEIHRSGGQHVVSYTLVLKRGSSFIPNYFGLILSDYDRAYFLLDSLPNTRVCKRGSLRILSADDVHRHPQSIESGLESIDKMTWADLWYDSITKGTQVYLCEDAKRILGFVSFALRDSNWLFIDAVAIDKKSQGNGLGGSLMRWSETYARAINCLGIELWAISDRVPFYENMGYKEAGPKLDLGPEKYSLMKRKLLYNLRPHVF